MAKRYPTDTELELGAKRQRVGPSTAGEDSVVFEGDTTQFLAELYNTVTTPGSPSDVTLEFEYGEILKSHSVVLIAMSPFMKTLYKKQSEPRVNLRTITKAAFTRLLEYTLRGRLQVELGDELEEVLKAARLLQLEEIAGKCEKKLERSLTVTNCLWIIHFAGRNNHHKLIEATEKFIATNLMEVGKTADWWTQTEEEFTVVCRAAKRHVANPETLADAILEWLEMNPKDPGVVTRLMRTKAFPLGDLPVDFITRKLMPHQALRGNHEAVKMASEAIQAKLLSSTVGTSPGTNTSSDSPPRSGQSATPAPPATPAATPGEKKDSSRPQTLLVAGWARHESKLYFWKWGSQTWDHVPMPRHGLGAAMLFFNSQVVVTGGRIPEASQKEGEENKIAKYTTLAKTTFIKLQTRSSTDGPPLLKARSDHGMVKVGKSLYVAGGDNTNVEEYSSDRKTWAVAGKLHSKVKKCGVGVLGDVILVVGGSVKGNENFIQAFDTRTGTRSAASLAGLLPVAMPEARCAGANQGKMVCLSREGKMVQVAGKEDNYAASAIKDLREMTADFHAFISGQNVVVCTGHLKEEVRVDSKRSVFLKYKLQDGKELDCEIPSLPELLRVYGLTTTRIAF